MHLSRFTGVNERCSVDESFPFPRSYFMFLILM